jgi:hypothetical protein
MSMADTLVKDIVEAVAALLNATGKPTGLEVTASRIKSAPGGKTFKRAAVFPLADNPKPDNTQRNRGFLGAHRILTLVVECRCAGTDLDNEVLRAWAISQIMKDESLGGLALDVNEGTTEWAEAQDAQADYSQALIEILVEYSRAKKSLEK